MKGEEKMALKAPINTHRRETTVVFDPENNEGKEYSFAIPQKKRVAAYARVSTEQDAQQNSYEAQIEYYTNYIQSKPDWVFVEIYADEGISGTSYKNRAGFNRMIDDAKAGKIDLILTKSISRFSRNTVDSLTVTRDLKAKGVEVFFEKENISSMDKTAELVFTMLSSIAQEESRSISENVRWGKQRSMEAGKVYVPYRSFLGYEKGEDGLPKIVPEEAEIVRSIYGRYLEGATLNQIAGELTASGITTLKGNRWTKDGIRRILTNEKYKGDARLQKTYIDDFLTKQVKINRGERKQWYIHDSHDAIVSPETFELVQKELARRSSRGGRYYDSPFTCKIICGDCGGTYGHKIWNSNRPNREEVWLCDDRYNNENVCSTPRIKDEELERAFIVIENRLLQKRQGFIDDYERDMLPLIGNTDILDERMSILNEELTELIDQIEKLIQNNAHHAQDQEKYIAQFNELNNKIEEKKAKISSIKKQISDTLTRRENTRIFLDGLKNLDSIIVKFDIPSWHALVDHVKIMPDKSIVFCLRNGCEETVHLAEVQ
jgi:Site-specific recombinases, DNA invertase Pin homologs